MRKIILVIIIMMAPAVMYAQPGNDYHYTLSDILAEEMSGYVDLSKSFKVDERDIVINIPTYYNDQIIMSGIASVVNRYSDIDYYYDWVRRSNHWFCGLMIEDRDEWYFIVWQEGERILIVRYINRYS